MPPFSLPRSASRARPLRRAAGLALSALLVASCGDGRDPVEPGLTDEVEVLDLYVVATGGGSGTAAMPSVTVNGLVTSLAGGPLAPEQRVAVELTSSGGGRDTLELHRSVCGSGGDRYWCDEVLLTLRAGADTAALRARARQERSVLLAVSGTNALLRTALSVEEAVRRASGWPEVSRAAASGAAGTNCLVGVSSEGCGRWWLWVTATRGPQSPERQSLGIRTASGDTIRASVRQSFGETFVATTVVP